LGRDFEKTKAAFDQREREGKEASAAYISSLHQDATRRRIGAFLRGPLGWIVAALLLAWLITRL
jgi:hypothetical protein